MNRTALLALGVAAVVAETAIWHSAAGAGDTLAGKIERAARAELDRQEMTMVQARVERGPLSRNVILSGPADDFQQTELVRIIGGLPGVGDVRWANPPANAEDVR